MTRPRPADRPSAERAAVRAPTVRTPAARTPADRTPADRTPADRARDSRARGDELRAGDLLRVTRRASVQFRRSIMFRVIRELDWTTYDGWVWLDGYQLDIQGNAVTRRSIFVQRAGLVLVRAAPRRAAVRSAAAPPRSVRRQPFGGSY